MRMMNMNMMTTSTTTTTTMLMFLKWLLILISAVSVVYYGAGCHKKKGTFKSKIADLQTGPSATKFSDTSEIESFTRSIPSSFSVLSARIAAPVVSTTTTDSKRWLMQDEESEQDLIQKIALKLKPAHFQFSSSLSPSEEMNENSSSVTPKWKPHQFLHLHHMKTGGTSMDHMMRCAIDRLRGNPTRGSLHGKHSTTPSPASAVYEIPYYSIHECSRARFADCLDKKESSCRPQMKNAAVMSYCAALKHLNEFGWTEWGYPPNTSVVGDSDEDHHPVLDENVTTTTSPTSTDRIRAFTVLRHPVDRVWSMFRFQTRICYKCMPLIEIYNLIDANTTVLERSDGTIHQFDDLCLNQLRNHEVTNMLTSSHWPTHPDPDDEETENAMVQEAIANMKKYFTVIGLTEELVETRRIFGIVFPWMNETLDGYSETCTLPHDNSSPSNNRCIKNEGSRKGDTHWDLPAHPDEETRKAILAHNQLDMKLYQAAVEYFELQRRAVEWGEQQS